MASESDGVIARVDKARQLLAEAKDASQVKQVADMARAAEVYARRQKLSQEAIDYAMAIKIDATALLGEFLGRAEKRGPKHSRGGGSKGSKREPLPIAPPTLADAGISKRESSDAQVLARAKKEKPQLYEEVRAGKKKVSQVRVELKREAKRADLEAKAAAVRETPADWKIVVGDVCSVLHNLSDRPRLIFADPPYNVGVDYGDGAKADKLPPDQYVAWVESWVRLSRSVVADDGSFWLLISDEYAAEACLAVKRHFTLRNWIVWYETFGINCSGKFNRTKRHLFYAVADPRKLVFHADAVSRPSARQVVYNDGRAATAGKLWDDLWAIPRLTGTAAERIPDFPTQLPLELLRPIVGCCSDPGDLVLDPFSGSGTSGVAALEAGRRYLGIERSARFAALSRSRLKGVSCAA